MRHSICAKVALEGVDSSSHAVAVDAALAVLEGLEAQSEVREIMQWQGSDNSLCKCLPDVTL